MNPFRILSLDGGGIKGVFPAAFLASVEQASGKRIADNFDLIVGTSTGGIIALGLGLGFSAEEMLAFYKTHGPQIFEETFGERRLGDSKSRLVIPAFSASRGEVYVFKTRHHAHFEFDSRELVRDVALATSAAPTYFRAHTLPSGVHLLDGGLWANNPVMVGIVEAVTYLDARLDNIVALSLGCSTSPLALRSEGDRNAGVAKWAFIGTEWLMRGQAINATNQARLLLGKDRVLRVQTDVEPRTIALDDARGIPRLEALGAECAREALPQLRRLFLSEPVAPFTPVAEGQQSYP